MLCVTGHFSATKVIMEGEHKKKECYLCYVYNSFMSFTPSKSDYCFTEATERDSRCKEGIKSCDNVSSTTNSLFSTNFGFS